ncbi:serine hydrolase domain-containing protein [Amycolatopsis antarctica]|nr:serine hydrolase domain-containing protein [Amycolatopsis antarctica]
MVSGRTGVVALTMLLVCVTGTETAGAATAPDVDGYLHDRLAATDTPGAAWAIVTGDSIERVGTWGRDGDGAPVTERTPFLWGSVSKPVTATAMLTMVEAGTVDLDEPVRTYLPAFALADHGRASRITVRHLLEHTSGIPGDAAGVTDRFEPRADPYREAVAALAEITPLSAPGDTHRYASANYLVLGAIVEAVSGRPFADYLREHVLDPLDMDGAITSPEQAGGLPDGHGYVFGQPAGLAPRYDRTGPSYGYLGGTVTDLAQFAMAQLDEGRHQSTQVLAPASVKSMQRGDARVTDTQRYGLGWREDSRVAGDGTRAVWHAGASPGYQTMLVLLPELDRGIVVLQNVYGFFQDEQLAGTGLGAATLLAGGRPGGTSGGPTYPVFVAALFAVLVTIAGAAGWAVYRMPRPGAVRRRRTVLGMAGWALTGLAAAHGAAVALPAAFGVDLSLMRLWAPDIGWLLTAIAVAGLALSAVRLTTGCLRLRQAGGPPADGTGDGLTSPGRSDP